MLFSRKTQIIKSIKTLVIISSAARENSKIFNVFLNNTFKRRRIISRLKNKFVFITQSRSSLRINFNSKFFNLTKNNTSAAKIMLRQKHNMPIKKFKFND